MTPITNHPHDERDEDVRWHSAYAYYRGETNDLVLDAVRPLLERLGPLARHAYFAPGWRRGPHVQLSVPTDPVTFRTVVRPAVEEELGGYLRRFPGPPAPDDERGAFDRLRRRAELEPGPAPFWPLAPANTVEFGPTTHFGLGDPVMTGLLTRFLAATTPLALRMVEAVRAGRTAQSIGYDLLITTAHALSWTLRDRERPPLAHAFVAFRGHAEGFIAACGDPERMRNRLDLAYRQTGASLVRRLDAVVDTLDNGSGRVPFVLDWVETVAPFREEARELLARGEIALPRPGYDGVGAEVLEQPWIDNSPLLGTIRDSRTLRAFLYEDPDFQPYRLMLSHTYLHLRRLGLAAPQRFALCHLAATAVETRYRSSALEQVRERAAARHAGTSAGGGRP
ncbi:thiopeptide maturation pyridine synthase [Streptomyces sp. NPDC055607]